MRNLCFLLAFLPLIIRAQAIYNAADYAAIGDTYLYSQTGTFTGVNFSQTGAGFTWNYSTLTPASQSSREVLAPNSAGYYLTYLAACAFGGGNPFACNTQWNNLTDLAIQDLDNLNLGFISFSNIVTHYRKTNTALDATVLGLSAGVGGVNVPYAVAYTIPDTVLRFPLTYLDQDSSRSRWAVDLSATGTNLGYRSSQRRTYTVEGWGSLTTPFQTYPNVLKIKTIIERRDTLVQNGNLTALPLTRAVTYAWWTPGSGQPVMEASGNILAGQEIITTVRYEDIQQCLPPQAQFFPLPPATILDPVLGTALIGFNNLSNNGTDYTWSFGDGTTSTQESPTKIYTAAGVYQVTLIVCNANCNPVQCDTATFPVTIIDTTAVLALPVVPPATCTGAPVPVANFSVNATQYAWDFGDGFTSADSVPQHAYTTPGTYTITLIASGNGNTDTATATITVSPPPAPDLGPDQFITTQQSVTLSPGTFAVYFWSTNQLSASISVTGASLGTGVHPISVTVTDTSGCTASDTVLITVTPATGINPLLNMGIQLTPNPAHTYVTLTSPTLLARPLTVRILSLTGQELQRAVWESNQSISLNISTLPAAIYLVEVRGEGIHQVFKLVHE
ncbi:MAG: PKD domain-containing protein [Bacteroidia bacterium]|nr:PKD domain-containing protein [Bacteroidia bacterium]